MRKRLTWAALLAALLTFVGCAGKETSEPKVEAENDYNEMAGRTEQSDIAEDQLTVNIIYVKDGQRYFPYRSDCAASDGSWITGPLVQIYTGNIHCNYAHSFLTQWTYIPSEAGSPEDAYEEIAPYIF